MKKLTLSIALAAGIMSAKAQDTTCTYFVGNEVYEFNYQTSEIISEDIHNSGLYTITCFMIDKRSTTIHFYCRAVYTHSEPES